MIISPLPRKLSTAIDGLLSGIAIVFLSPVFLVAWILDKTEDRFWPRDTEWQRWFAWYPVRAGMGMDAPLVWFERVDRTLWHGYRVYRRIDDTSTHWPWEFDGE